MALAPPLIKVAKKLIKQFGRTVTLNKVTDGAYNPDAGSSAIITTSTINGFIGQYTTADFSSMQMGVSVNVHENFIMAGDSPMYSTDAIDKNDTVIVGGVKYAVTMVTVYGVNDSNVLYVSNLRRL